MLIRYSLIILHMYTPFIITCSSFGISFFSSVHFAFSLDIHCEEILSYYLLFLKLLSIWFLNHVFHWEVLGKACVYKLWQNIKRLYCVWCYITYLRVRKKMNTLHYFKRRENTANQYQKISLGNWCSNDQRLKAPRCQLFVTTTC